MLKNDAERHRYDGMKELCVETIASDYNWLATHLEVMRWVFEFDKAGNTPVRHVLLSGGQRLEK